MDSQLGLANQWTQGDGVTKAVAVLLLVMSLASWMVIVVKALNLLKHARQSRAVDEFWRSHDPTKAMTPFGADVPNPYRSLAIEGDEASAHYRARTGLDEPVDKSEWLTSSLRSSMDDSTAELQAGLAVLASAGSTAPFVGLFGTVWGIYHALLALGSAGQATIDKVAGPIGESLIMTALGLAVAIPAVLGYNALVRGNKSILMKLSRFARDLHSYHLTGTRVSRKSQTRKAG